MTQAAQTGATTKRPPAEVIRDFSRPLATQRLTLNRLNRAVGSPLYALFNDWEIVRWLAQPDWPQTPATFDRSLQTMLGEQDHGRALYLTVHKDETLVGAVTWTATSTGAVLGYWIGRAHWGKGYVTEAAGALCDLIFAETAEPHIRSGAFDGNQASLRVQRKLGFVEIGQSTHFSVPEGRDLRHIDTRLTRTARQVAREKAHK